MHVFDTVTGIAQMMIFFLAGLLATPSELPAVLLPAALIMLFMTVIARPAAVAAILLPFRSHIRQIGVVSWRDCAALLHRVCDHGCFEQSADAL